jgi:predicted nucleic acid-binding Zn ribbon protein
MRKSEKSQKRADLIAFTIGFILILVLILIYVL